jgi:hypothetical protein
MPLAKNLCLLKTLLPTYSFEFGHKTNKPVSSLSNANVNLTCSRKACFEQSTETSIRRDIFYLLLLKYNQCLDEVLQYHKRYLYIYQIETRYHSGELRSRSSRRSAHLDNETLFFIVL